MTNFLNGQENDKTKESKDKSLESKIREATPNSDNQTSQNLKPDLYATGGKRILNEIRNQHTGREDFKVESESDIVLPLYWTHISYEYKVESPKDVGEEYKFIKNILTKEFGRIYITNFPTSELKGTKLPTTLENIYPILSRLDKKYEKKESILWTNFTTEGSEDEVWGYISWMKTSQNKNIIRVGLSVKEVKEKAEAGYTNKREERKH